MQFRELRGEWYAAANIPATAAGTAIEMPIVRAPFKARVTGITWIPGAAITAHATNYFTLTVRNREAAAGTVVMATRAYSATNGVATTPEDLALSATEADLLVEAGEVLTAHFTHAASGLAIPAGLVQLAYQLRG